MPDQVDGQDSKDWNSPKCVPLGSIFYFKCRFSWHEENRNLWSYIKGSREIRLFLGNRELQVRIWEINTCTCCFMCTINLEITLFFSPSLISGRFLGLPVLCKFLLSGQSVVSDHAWWIAAQPGCRRSPSCYRLLFLLYNHLGKNPASTHTHATVQRNLTNVCIVTQN